MGLIINQYGVADVRYGRYTALRPFYDRYDRYTSWRRGPTYLFGASDSGVRVPLPTYSSGQTAHNRSPMRQVPGTQTRGPDARGRVTRAQSQIWVEMVGAIFNNNNNNGAILDAHDSCIHFSTYEPWLTLNLKNFKFLKTLILKKQ